MTHGRGSLIPRSAFRVACAVASLLAVATALSMPGNDKRIYGVPNSGWQSSSWNWGSAVGTGHDCAKICRQQYGTKEARRTLIDQLLTTPNVPADFEEVKLVLALSWQRGRWDKRDGGLNGYGDVLELMARADRYERNSPSECARYLVQDMQARYQMLQPSPTQLAAMENLMVDCESDMNRGQRRCSGLVLEAMGFVEHGC